MALLAGVGMLISPQTYQAVDRSLEQIAPRLGAGSRLHLIRRFLELIDADAPNLAELTTLAALALAAAEDARRRDYMELRHAGDDAAAEAPLSPLST